MAGCPDKKHPCADCTSCQWCSDDRCRLCRKRSGCRRRKLSLTEQIALYESLNSAVSAPEPAGDDTPE
ncbi:MAG TPA: hypothetical protein VF795_08865 [Desulfuromonadaceae bacterium]